MTTRPGVGRLVLCCAVLAPLAGCGGGNLKQKTHPVTGKVTVDGKPLAGATVVFHAVDKANFKWEELPQGTTDANGKFTLFTYEPGDGAPAGEYKVAVELAAAADDQGGDQVKRARGPRIPDRYHDPSKSGLTAKVTSGTNELPTFELTTK
jgi:hypothetical protein